MRLQAPPRDCLEAGLQLIVDYVLDLAVADHNRIAGDQIEDRMKSVEATTPVSGAAQGAFGTVITSIVVGAIAGIFLRKK